MKYIAVPTKQFLVLVLITLVLLLPYSSFGSSLDLGLYNSTDKVKILTHLNFKNEVLDRNHSNLVEFYNSYCGHCRRFAPNYKQLAEDLYSWRDVLQVAAIDCAVDDNNGICREYEVMAYPTLRYFGPAYQPSAENYGKAIETQVLLDIKDMLIQFIVAENKTNNMPAWPDLQPVQNDSAAALFEGLDSLKKYVIIVYEPENSTVGIEMILHFLRYPEISVKRIIELELAAKYELGTKYKIAIVSRQGSIVPYEPLNANITSYNETIRSFLNSQHITERPDTKPTTTTTTTANTNPKPIENSGIERTELLRRIQEVRKNKHMVYQADLEMAIRTVIRNEIPKASHINGEKLVALQRFLTVLERYNPMGPSGKLLIKRLAVFTANQSTEILGDDFEKKVHELEQLIGPIYSSKDFVGCVGSQAGLRGFSCSLWQLFHYMSVQAANMDTSQNPLEVLHAMHGYVKHFFGCSECSEHFQAMALRRKIWNTSTKDDSVLWLWQAHNEVNKRLAGDATEDPQFRKIQFPSASSCPQCYKKSTVSHAATTISDDDKWDKVQVLQFLKNIYNPEYISRYGLNNPDVLQPSVYKIRQRRYINNVFSVMDLRMGILLYGFCIVMLVAAFKLFVNKGGYRRKSYAHDMLGKA